MTGKLEVVEMNVVVVVVVVVQLLVLIVVIVAVAAEVVEMVIVVVGDKPFTSATRGPTSITTQPAVCPANLISSPSKLKNFVGFSQQDAPRISPLFWRGSSVKL